MKPQHIRREDTSRAVINTDKSGLEAYRMIRGERKKAREGLRALEEDIREIQSDISEIKMHIKLILDLVKNDG